MEIIPALRDRHGFQTLGMRAAACLLGPFFRCKCDIPKEIEKYERPVVFVCNHYEVFGPLAIVLSLPLRFRLWTNNIVVEPMQNIDNMIIGTQHIFPFLSESSARGLLIKVAPLLQNVIGYFKPIAVYRNDLGKHMAAVKKTVNTMLNGEHIVLFPETAIPAYSHGSVTEFFRSFALIGEVLRRRSGENAAFCPIYVDKRHRRLCFGSFVYYGEGSADEECTRVVDQLRAQMLCMAEKAKGGK